MAKPIWKEILEEEGSRERLLNKPSERKKYPFHLYYCSRCNELVKREKKHMKPKWFVCDNCKKRKTK